MTEILTDCPEALDGFLQPGAAWYLADPVTLGEADQAFWLAAGPRASLWRGDARDAAPGFWSRLHVVGQARRSLFDVFRDLSRQPLEMPGPVACLALEGAAFHGQHGRPWMAAAGNLHLSAWLPSPLLPPGDLVAVPVLPAVALLDAVRDLAGASRRVAVKWVGDVLLDGRKVGGALSAAPVQGDRVGPVLVGIGLNVAVTPPVVPTAFVPEAGSLAEAGVPATLASAAGTVLGALAARWEQLRETGPDALLEAYRRASVVVGREVWVFDDDVDDPQRAGRPLAHGIVRAIGPDLALVLDQGPVRAGRVALAEACRRFSLPA